MANFDVVVNDCSSEFLGDSRPLLLKTIHVPDGAFLVLPLDEASLKYYEDTKIHLGSGSLDRPLLGFGVRF